jgi:hypothetical protein
MLHSDLTRRLKLPGHGIVDATLHLKLPVLLSCPVWNFLLLEFPVVFVDLEFPVVFVVLLCSALENPVLGCQNPMGL